MDSGEERARPARNLTPAPNPAISSLLTWIRVTVTLTRFIMYSFWKLQAVKKL
jgi:hypothetical protein